MKKNKKDSLGDRMKRYEAVSKTTLMRRTPVVIRIDGKAFHTFTRGFQKPFDEVLIQSMQDTTKYLCEKIQGCVFGYTQSDEITLVLCDYQTLETSPWYDYEVQKLCSIAASMATMKFNQAFYVHMESYIHPAKMSDIAGFGDTEETKALWAQYDIYRKAHNTGAMFDARCFNVPKEDLVNCIIWRQQDATRNSIQMVGQCNFSHKELQNKSCNMIQDMLHEQKGINWNDFPTHQKRGTAVLKQYTIKLVNNPFKSDPDEVECLEWFIDKEMPILTQDRDYVESLINFV